MSKYFLMITGYAHNNAPSSKFTKLIAFDAIHSIRIDDGPLLANGIIQPTVFIDYGGSEPFDYVKLYLRRAEIITLLQWPAEEHVFKVETEYQIFEYTTIELF